MTLTTQFYTMLAMAGMGAWLGASLDTYTRFVIRSNTARWLLFIHDLLFWMVQGLLFFYVLLSVNEGEFRIYILLAVLLGFAAYQSLFKRIYLKILDWMISFFVLICRIFGKMMRMMVFRPIVWTFYAIFATILFTMRNIYVLFRFFALSLYKIIKIVCYPIYVLMRQCFRLLPARIRHAVKRFFQKGAGFLKKGKKLFITIQTKFLKK
ncbi:spore cortex biosynthesis protein YabQ [Bacillus sonorensis]|uniref:Spore protein YabQ n=2 Tax=Bacillus sonorensis TaxID=119858 RepID=M5PBW5_9BACI|nr:MULTISPECIES: spore cortex biosynthesis protein YabQ [Bacillus]TWK77164.1 Spore protein YabQ [Bacillus paralicheniformis]ASB86652.1 Spore protein YabQ [Bacillus sonorensis]EME72372.1 spore protein YabQ [Bacillus sonorensis L12]MBG9913624.1 spore coat protein [Bacillus sonorensis]MCF7615720.1 spore cortex biosynthesis protein YabQ [Bacillus sonorensis]